MTRPGPAPEPGLHLLRRGGVALTCRDTGGDGLPVVFQHGLCADARQGLALVPDGPGLRGLALDCRGHGASEPGPERDLSLATFADDVAALVEGRVGGPAVLGGTSMGAAIALRLAVHRPELARALVLVRPAWTTEAAPDNLEPHRAIGRLLARHPPAQAWRIFTAGAAAARLATEAPAAMDALRAFADRTPTAVTASLLCRLGGDGPGVSDDDLRRIAVPTLVVGRSDDPLHPLRHTERLARTIPGARVAILPREIDRAARRLFVRAAIGRFLAGLGPGRDARGQPLPPAER